MQPGWNEPGADLTATGTRRNGNATGWTAAGLAPAPNLQTKLVWREAPPVKVMDTLRPVRITRPNATTWVFDMGQNQAGFPQLELDGTVPAGTVIRMQPSELLAANGTVSPGSTGRKRHLDTYTTAGDGDGETCAPQFMYHGFQYIQVTGLPAELRARRRTRRRRADQRRRPSGGTSRPPTRSSTRSTGCREYSIRSNMQSIFTDCPHREKLGWLADMIQSMGAIRSKFDVAALPAQHAARHGRVPAAGRAGPGHRARDPGLQRRVPRRLNWGGAVVLTPY